MTTLPDEARTTAELETSLAAYNELLATLGRGGHAWSIDGNQATPLPRQELERRRARIEQLLAGRIMARELASYGIGVDELNAQDRELEELHLDEEARHAEWLEEQPHGDPDPTPGRYEDPAGDDVENGPRP